MIKTKLHKAGLKEGHADVVADVLDFADEEMDYEFYTIYNLR
ncbi:hypothetical protein [Neobacillus sp. SuZ13]|nr:hypothetical protein [Neobacillus sp. SuZ13]WHY67302.1 hypothetical protein QNH17_01035 [Neobacillus sp. SuZ13]